jgi:antitoxin ChpS
MITVNIRKQGGAAVITIPSDILKLLNIQVGSTLELDVNSKGFSARPINNPEFTRYSLVELLTGVTSEDMAKLNKETKWAREGKPVGRELT